jgi:hypothetical protein
VRTLFWRGWSGKAYSGAKDRMEVAVTVSEATMQVTGSVLQAEHIQMTSLQSS